MEQRQGIADFLLLKSYILISCTLPPLSPTQPQKNIYYLAQSHFFCQIAP